MVTKREKITENYLAIFKYLKTHFGGHISDDWIDYDAEDVVLLISNIFLGYDDDLREPLMYLLETVNISLSPDEFEKHYLEIEKHLRAILAVIRMEC